MLTTALCLAMLGTTPTLAEPARLAMQLAQADEPAVRQGWIQALQAPEALTRSTAARLLATADVVEAGPALIDQLRREADLRVAAELVRAAGDVAPKQLATLVADATYQLPAVLEPLARAALGSPKDKPSAAQLRSIVDLPAGLMPALLAAVGCQPGDEALAVGRVRYDDRGRARAVTIDAGPDGPACEEAIWVLFSLARQPVATRTPEGTDAMVLQFQPTLVECMAEPPPGTPLHQVGDAIEAPHILQRVAPLIPATAVRDRVVGFAYIGLEVTENGCPRALELRRAPRTELALPTLVAVSKWRFQPVMVDGRPGRVQFDVTLKFDGAGAAP